MELRHEIALHLDGQKLVEWADIDGLENLPEEMVAKAWAKAATYAGDDRWAIPGLARPILRCMIADAKRSAELARQEEEYRRENEQSARLYEARGRTQYSIETLEAFILGREHFQPTKIDMAKEILRMAGVES